MDSIIILLFSINLNILFIMLWINRKRIQSNVFFFLNILYGSITSKITWEFFKFLEVWLERMELIYPYNHYFYLMREDRITYLDSIIKLFRNTDYFINIFIGTIAFITAIYIYILSVESPTKKHILNYLSKQGEMFFLSFTLISMYLFKGDSLFLFGGVLYLIYLLFTVVKWIVRLNSKTYINDNFKDILLEFRGERREENTDVRDLYLETREELYEGVLESNYYTVKRNYDYLVCEFREFPEELVGDIEESRYEIISYMYKLYSAIFRERNDEIFQATCYLHYQLADIFYQRRDYENFDYALQLTEKTYEYYKESENKELAWNVLNWMEGTLSNFYREYKEEFEEGLKWYASCFRVVTNLLIKETKVNEADDYFYEQLLRLVKSLTKYEYPRGDRNIEKVVLLETSVLLGVFMIFTKKKKDIGNKITIIKNEIENTLSALDILGCYKLMALYNFVKENRIVRQLKWEEYFRPEMNIVGGTSWSSSSDLNLDECFVELLSESNLKLMDSNAKSNYDDSLGTSLKEVEDSFQKKAGTLLRILDTSNLNNEQKKKVKDFLEKLKVQEEKTYRDDVIDSDLSKEKLNNVKLILKEELGKNRLIKFLKKRNKYIEKFEDTNEKAHHYGINKLYPKDWFIEPIREVGIVYNHIIKQMGNSQNKRLESLFISELDKLVTEDTILKSLDIALNNIKNGTPAIFFSGIFYSPILFKDMDNFIGKASIEEKDSEIYAGLLEGYYRYNGKKIPIFFLSGNSQAVYAFDLDKLEGLIHYGCQSKGEDLDRLEYSFIRIRDMKNVLVNEEYRKQFIKDDDEMKEKELKSNVWFELYQEVELKFNTTKVYKILKKDILKDK